MHHWLKILVIIGLGVVAIWLIQAPIASSFLSKKLGVQLSVGAMRFSPSEFHLYRFKINNPRRFQMPLALQVASITTSYEWSQLTSNPSIIDHIEMDDVVLNIEFSNALGTKNNWTALLSEVPKRKPNARDVIVKELVLTDVNVNIRNQGIFGKSSSKHIDRMEFFNISSRGGFPVSEFMNQVFQGAGLMQYLEKIPETPVDILQKINPFSQSECFEKEKGPIL